VNEGVWLCWPSLRESVYRCVRWVM
jgi:hypothetical protein